MVRQPNLTIMTNLTHVAGNARDGIASPSHGSWTNPGCIYEIQSLYSCLGWFALPVAQQKAPKLRPPQILMRTMKHTTDLEKLNLMELTTGKSTTYLILPIKTNGILLLKKVRF